MAKKLSEMTKEERREYNHNLIKESAKIPNVLNVFYKPIYCKECKTELTHNEVRNGSGYCEQCEEAKDD